MNATPLTPEQRKIRITANVIVFGKRPRLVPNTDSGRISIVGFGPSLHQTWSDVSGPVMTTSGAHDFLIERGIIPKYHVEMDAREHKANFFRNPHPDVTYFINSQCHPKVFAALQDYNVVMWHNSASGCKEMLVELFKRLEPGAILVRGGSNVGMRAIVVAHIIGFRDYDLFGMDCSYQGLEQWAGEHYTPNQEVKHIRVGVKNFYTSETMLKSTDDFLNQLPMLQGARFRIHGEGLLKTRLNLYKRNPQLAVSKDWWQPVEWQQKGNLLVLH